MSDGPSPVWNMGDEPLTRATALQGAIKEAKRRQEYAIIGAWRAGFDYLDVLRPGVTDAMQVTPDTREFIPSNTPTAEIDYTDLEAEFGYDLYVDRYELCEMADTEIRAALDAHLDDRGSWP